MLDQVDHLGEESVLADLGGAHSEQAFLVQGRADHRIAGAFLLRQRFAGGQGFVDMAVALDHFAVAGDFFAGAHQHQVADRHGLDWHLHLDTITQQHRALGPQLQHLADGLGGAALGTGLQVAADQVEGGDGGGHLDEGGHGVEEPHQADKVGRQAAQADQHIHIGGAVAQRFPGRYMGAGTGDKHRDGGEYHHYCQVAGHRYTGHGQGHQQHDQGRRYAGYPHAPPGVAQVLLFLFGPCGFACGTGQHRLGHLIAGLFHGLFEGGQAGLLGIEFDAYLVAGDAGAPFGDTR